MWAYAMIATGLINWDYQRAQPHIVLKSLGIVLPGLFLLGLTFTPAAKPALTSMAGKVLIAVVGLTALSYAFLN